jgi:TDG/mug DNA glycosylase family protein
MGWMTYLARILILKIMILPDLLQDNLYVVFCGTAASAISAQQGAYYANPTNYFWRTLHEIGLTPHQLPPKDFPQLLNYGIGLTDVAKYASGNDSDLQPTDYARTELVTKIEKYAPQVLAFTSKRAASEVLQLPTNRIPYGWQSQAIAQTRLMVLTSPSGAARAYWDKGYWRELADFVLSQQNIKSNTNLHPSHKA